MADDFFRVSGSGMKGARWGWKLGTTITDGIKNRRQEREAEERRQADQRARDELISNPPPIHGSAEWASAGELKSANILRDLSAFDSPSSLFLGMNEDPEGLGHVQGQLHWDGEGHVLTVAPTRSGKATMMIVPNLLRYRGSCIVLDPKGELYRDTSAWRAANVGPVYRIAPFEQPTHSFNPVTAIRNEADARALADVLIPDDPKAQRFFKNDGVAFVSGLLLFMLEKGKKPEHKTLGELRNLTTAGLSDVLDLARSMKLSDIPAARHGGGVLLSKKQDSVSTLIDTLNSELSAWSDPGVVRATSTSDVDFRSLKDRAATVYITVPMHLTSAFAPLIRVILTSALDAMVQNERTPKIPVLFVLDEFLALGPFPKFRDAIRTHAGAGVRLWFFLQDVPTLEEHYPQSWKAFFNSSVKIFFGTDEVFTGKLISESLGDRTVAYEQASFSESDSRSGGVQRNHNKGMSSNHSVQFTARPLLDPTQVVQLLSGTNPDQTRPAIILMRNTKPILARLVPWFRGEKLKARVGTYV